MAGDLHFLSITALAREIGSGRLSPVAVTQAILDRIGKLDDRLGSYITLVGERALEKAHHARSEIARGFYRGPLHGVPIGIKDVVDTDFAPTTVGMAIRANHVPNANATIVDRLESAGAIILGKQTTAEAIFIGHHPKLRTPVNPRDPAYWTGVSSSGSGIATASGLCFGAIGTDTGGSIRVPSWVHGLVGLKPTWGRVSCHGVFPLAPSMDHVGPIARSAGDAALMLQAIAGRDPADPTTALAPVPDYSAELDRPLSGIRVGLDRSFATEGVDGDVVNALEEMTEALCRLGADTVPVEMPPVLPLLHAGSLICAVEAALAHDATYPAQASEYGPEISAELEMGRGASGLELAAALLERQTFAGRFDATLAGVDLLLTPTMPIKVPTLERLAVLFTDVTGEGVSLTRFTFPPNLTGHPALTLPAGIDSAGHPIGMQLVGHRFDEALLLRVGRQFQSMTDWHTRRPAI